MPHADHAVLINLKLAFLFCCYLFYDNVTATLLELRLFMLYIYTFYIDCKSYWKTRLVEVTDTTMTN